MKHSCCRLDNANSTMQIGVRSIIGDTILTVLLLHHALIGVGIGIITNHQWMPLVNLPTYVQLWPDIYYTLKYCKRTQKWNRDIQYSLHDCSHESKQQHLTVRDQSRLSAKFTISQTHTSKHHCTIRGGDKTDAITHVASMLTTESISSQKTHVSTL